MREKEREGEREKERKRKKELGKKEPSLCLQIALLINSGFFLDQNMASKLKDTDTDSGVGVMSVDELYGKRVLWVRFFFFVVLTCLRL